MYVKGERAASRSANLRAPAWSQEMWSAKWRGDYGWTSSDVR